MATAGIPGDLLQADDTSGSTHLNFDGMMSELLARIDPYKYRTCITTYEKICKIMHAECLKAVYGTLDAAILIWAKISTDMERWGFNMNQYDWYVINKYIKGEQCKIL